jgi:acetyltransferase-like isoleucine patch superfamily enzyme
MAPDQWFVRQVMRFIVWRYRATMARELFLLEDQAEAGHTAFLTQSLGSKGQGVEIRPGTRIQYAERIHLGTNVRIGENCYLMGQGGISIGDASILANHTIIATVNHHTDGIYHSHAYTQPVTLGENVWTGSGAIILPGVTIGDSAIIGAGAVVTGDIEANQIAYGVPARPTGNAPQDPEQRREAVMMRQPSST